MKKHLNIISIFLKILLGIGVVTPNFDVSMASSNHSNTLRVGVLKPFDKVYPITQVPGESQFIRNLISPPVIAIDENQKWNCVVCEAIPNLKDKTLVLPDENSKELISYWKISDKFFWDDGKPVTGFDVKFTLNFLRDNGNPLPKLVVSVDHKQPRKFKIAFEEPRPDYYLTMAISLLPHQKKNLLTSAIEKNDINRQIQLARGLSYGPYRIRSIDNSLTLDENQFFAGLKNDFQTIEVIRTKSLSELEAKLHNSSLDMVADGELTYNSLKKILNNKEIQSSWKLIHSLSSTTDFLQFNLKNPYLADQLVRRAIYHSIDRESILSDVFDNYGSVAPIPPFPPSTKDSKVYSYNLKKAQYILRSSGWILHEGVVAKNGAKLELNLAYQNTVIKRKIANRIRSALAAIGIYIKLKPFNDKISFQNHIRKGSYRDLALLSINIYPEPPLSLLYHSNNAPNHENDFSGDNLGFWSNKRGDKILNELKNIFQAKERREKMLEFSAIYREDTPSIPLMIRPSYALISRNLVNVHFPGNGYHSSLYSSGWNTMKREKSTIF